MASAPDLSPLVAHVWDWFCELHEERGSNGFCPLPITFGAITAWMTATGNKAEAWEVRAIRKIDAAYIAACAEKRQKS